MKRTMRYVILGAGILVIVVVAILWRSRLAARPEEAETRSAVVERGAMLVAVSASGSVEPQARVDLAFEVPGRVAAEDRGGVAAGPRGRGTGGGGRYGRGWRSVGASG